MGQNWWAGPNQTTPISVVRSLNCISRAVGSITSRVLRRGAAWSHPGGRSRSADMEKHSRQILKDKKASCQRKHTELSQLPKKQANKMQDWMTTHSTEVRKDAHVIKSTIFSLREQWIWDWWDQALLCAQFCLDFTVIIKYLYCLFNRITHQTNKQINILL